MLRQRGDERALEVFTVFFCSGFRHVHLVVKSACRVHPMSICPLVSAWLPLDGFTMKFYVWSFYKDMSRKSNFFF